MCSHQVVSDKISELKKITDDLQAVVYIGDDINDLSCMKVIKDCLGIVGCPNDALSQVKPIADFIAPHNGGDGAVRDFIEWIVKENGFEY